ncbi:MAG: class I SAM-dependent methyltransferase [Planctomycetota bacterium]
MGFRVLSQRVEVRFPDAWYELADPEHVWLQWRLRALANQLRELGVPLDAPLRALEVGCGQGALRRQLEDVSAWSVDGADLNEQALRGQEPGRGELLLYDVHDRLPELAGRYDVVVAFDVIEHVEDAHGFLASAIFHLRPGGWLLINVPACAALWSEYDVAAGHHRRYGKRLLKRELAGLPLELVDQRYWGLSLLPALAVRKLLTRSGGAPEQVIRRGFRVPGRAAQALLRGVMRLETRLLQRAPVGSSLLAAARKV